MEWYDGYKGMSIEEKFFGSISVWNIVSLIHFLYFLQTKWRFPVQNS